MPTVVFIEHTGAVHQVEAPLNKSLMQVALDNAVPGILGDCGGSCSCATCHGYVDEPWAARLPPRSESKPSCWMVCPNCATTAVYAVSCA